MKRFWSTNWKWCKDIWKKLHDCLFTRLQLFEKTLSHDSNRFKLATSTAADPKAIHKLILLKIELVRIID